MGLHVVFNRALRAARRLLSLGVGFGAVREHCAARIGTAAGLVAVQGQTTEEETPMRKQSLVALLGATALMALPVMTPDLAGGGSYAYAAGARGGDANGGNGARGGRGGRGGDGGDSEAEGSGGAGGNGGTGGTATSGGGAANANGAGGGTGGGAADSLAGNGGTWCRRRRGWRWWHR